MTTIGYATLQIIPSLDGVSDAVRKQLGVVPDLGKAAGRQLGENLAAGVDQAAKRVEAASKKVEAARRKEADAAGRVRVAEAKLEALRERGITDVGRLAQAEERVSKAKRDHELASKTLATTVKNESEAQKRLAEAQKKVAESSDEAATKGGRFSGWLQKLKGDAEAGSSGLSAVSAKLGGLFRMAGGASLLALPGVALAKGFGRLKSLDEAKAKLRGLGRTTEEAASIIDSVSEAVSGTAFGLDEAAGSAAVFSTMGVQTGQDMTRVMKLLADTTAQAGSSFGEMTPIFQKVVAAGGLTTETFDQLNERGTGVGEALSKHLGIPLDEIRDKAKEISFEDFAAAMEKNIGGAAQKMGDTFSGAVGNMGAAFGRVGEKILKPLFDFVIASSPSIIAGINKVGEAGQGVVEAVLPKLQSAGELFKQYSGWIIPIGAAVGAVVVAFKAWTTAVAVWRGVVTAAVALQTAWNAVLAANPIGLIVLAIIGLGAALVTAYKRSETFRNIVNGVWTAVKDTIGAVVSWFTDTAWPAIQGAWNWITDAFETGKTRIAAFIDGIKATWQGLVDKAGEVKDWIVERWDGLVDYFRNLPSRITEFAGRIFEPLREAAKTVFNGIAILWNNTVGKISFTTPDWIPGVGGKTFSMPTIPTFADGGYTGDLPVNAIAGVVHGGEFVVRADSTDRLENAYPGLLDFLNNHGALPAGYKSGGAVGGRRRKSDEWLASLGLDPDEPLGPGRAPEAGLQQRTIALSRTLSAVFPEIQSIGGVRQDRLHWHPSGLALDVMIPGGTTRGGRNPEGKALGDRIWKFVTDHADELGVDIEASLWRTDTGGDHYDHLHLVTTGGGKPQKDQEFFLPKKLQDEIRAAQKSTSSAAPGSTPVEPAAATAGSSSSGGSSGSGSYPTSISGWAGFAAEQIVGGQVKSALDVFGIPDSPGWLQGLSQFIGGLSISDHEGNQLFGGSGGSSLSNIGSMFGNTAQTGDDLTPLAAQPVAHGTTGGTPPGPVAEGQPIPQPGVVYNIHARDTEDAFIRAQRIERERAAAKLARF